MQKNFTIAKYEVSVEAGDHGLSLPAYKGSTLRGGFGNAFKRISCSMREKECRSCLLKLNCPYAYIFETAPPPGSEALRNYENVPRPFIIEPPLESKTDYRPGEKLRFNLILIGNAINYLPYFIVAFRELGEMGIGRMRKKYRLAEIRAVNPINHESEIVYHVGDQLVRNVNLTLQSDIGKIMDGSNGILGIQQVCLEFQTMTRIKFEEKFVQRVEFHILIRNLLRRLSSLAYFHHDWELDLDFAGLIERAAEVRLIKNDTRWVDWERYSSRQENKMNLGGVVGRVEYEGDLGEFMPLLRLGELVHVGKGAVFGMGKFIIFSGKIC
ncbi:CRISPR system precrRNA processing endoribonuclease RAMP protein Cas6 [Pelotomaculum isophthalicicum JI]|uniref:CRISPR system precrRNA processing endoribonuclease RAMP protein Cas6 n=1 Tax=Pelotomaculum isophthalicicum JI TaxID=947010 RepID=A0A9X4H2B4_9FIRM|nr:CRISPR system precrRNA processing endoribonuclease RAMP protein Cas6 [Pelotomaculum isophthalicicum]MDF9408715.1 CRISPR system precrRNA processing endoribonuclease RAMP protein Cas6 [Pelotomaculum isophthalicicum JI]